MIGIDLAELKLLELERELLFIKANEPSAYFLFGTQYLTRDEMIIVFEDLIERKKNDCTRKNCNSRKI